MDSTASNKSTITSHQIIPPKRGQIKIKIVKGIIRSAAAIAGNGKKHKENGGFHISTPSTPATPTGYQSDVSFES
uniref:Uncharacterized protein n=1 Tax=Manihot esculenta TaxID=3983 RepID=A0A2C9V188_MANES